MTDPLFQMYGSKDYDKVFVDLMFSEKIQSFSSFSPRVIDNVVSIIRLYNDITPKIASEMLADLNFTRQLDAIHKKTAQEFKDDYEGEDMNDEQKEKILDEIYYERIKKAIDSKMASLLAEKERDRANASYQKSLLESRLKYETEEKGDLIKKVESQESEMNGFQKKQIETDNMISDLNTKIAALNLKNTNLEKAYNGVKWVAGILIGLIIAFVIEPKVWMMLQGLNIQGLNKSARFVLYVIALSIVFGVGLGIKRSWKMVTIIDALGGGIAVLWFIFNNISGE